MTTELAELERLVQALVQRERALAGWTALGRLAVVLATGAAAALAMRAWQVERPVGVALLVGFVGLATWFAVVAPWWRAWRRTADPMRQARRLEAREPRLRGRLVTAVGHAEGTRGAESAALLALVGRRAWALVGDTNVADVLPSADARRWGVGGLATWAIALGVALNAPGGVGAAWAYWAGDRAEAEADGGVTPAAVEEVSRVGDLTLRYIYPAYTGLEPYEVPNSTGEAHAVPGTRVEVVAKAAQPISSAALVVYEQPALDAEVRDGRTIRAGFTIGPETGSYRILTIESGETRSTRHFPVVPEPDLPPEVTLDVERDTLEVPVDLPLDIPWRARDDYGVERVQLVLDGQPRPASLKVPRGRIADVGDVIQVRPADLGMVAGGTYELTVRAWDNDTVSGSKAGVSPTLRIVVLGADGVARLTRDTRRELLDILVDTLGDHLEDVYPPGRVAGAYARWGEQVFRRYEPLVAFVDAYRSPRTHNPIWGPVVDALEDGRTLIRFSQVSFVPGDTRAANGGSLEALDGFRTAAIDSLEIAALHVDLFLRNEAIGRVEREADRAEREASTIRAAVSRETVDVQELLFALDTVAGIDASLDEALIDLPDGGLTQMIRSRLREIEQISKAARASLAASDVADTQELTSRLGTRLEELAQAIVDEIERQRERARDQRSKAKELADKLKELIEAQDTLADDVQSVRELDGETYRTEIADLWLRIEDQARGVREALLSYDADLADAQRLFNERAYVEGAIVRADDALDAAVARDVGGLWQQTLDLQAHWLQYAQRQRQLQASGLIRGGPGSSKIQTIREEVQLLLEMLELLRRRAEAGDPALRERIREIQPDQGDLLDDLAAIVPLAEEVVRELPVTPRDLLPALDDADARMDEAYEQLGRGEGMQAEGSQRAAAQHLREALLSLMTAQQQSAQQQAQQEEGGGEGGDGGQDPAEGQDGGRGGDENTRQPERIQLPEPEDYLGPDAYRDLLLRGMEGDVPDEYRALKRRYYEELVHQ